MNDRAPPPVKAVYNESGIEVKPLYTAADVEASGGLTLLGDPGRVPVHARHPPADVPQAALDDAPVRGLRQPARNQPALQVPDRQRPDRAERRLRPADPDRPGFGRPAGRGRSRARGHVDRHAARFRDRLRRHRPGQDHRLADDQRRRRDPDRDVPGDGREARLRHQEAARHGAERHPQGIHRPRHLDLSGPAVDQAGGRHHRVLRRARAQVQPGVGLRLPHPRIGRDAGAGDGLCLLHRQGLRRRGDRPRPDGGRIRRTPVLQLQHLRQHLRAGHQVPRRPQPVGQDHEGGVPRQGTRARCGCA